MIYLKSYEKYQFYDNKALSLEECKEKFLKNCNEFNLDSDYFIIRNVNMPINDVPYIVDPKSYERKSIITKNYYTYIIDNSDDWKDYPKRKNSIICSYSKILSKNWLVVPYDGSKWGVSNSFDIWFAFKLCIFHMDDLFDFNKYLGILYSTLFIETLNDDSKENFFFSLGSINDKIRKISEEDFKNLFDNRNKKPILIFWESVFKLFKYLKSHITEESTVKNGSSNVRIALEKLFNPEDNGFKSINYDDLVNPVTDDVEVWSDSKCLLIPFDDKPVNTINLLKEWRKGYFQDDTTGEY